MKKCNTLSNNIFLSPVWKIHDGYLEKIVTVFKVPVLLVRAVCVDSNCPDAKSGQLFQIYIRDYDSGHLSHQDTTTLQYDELSLENTTARILDLCTLILLSSVENIQISKEV